MKLNLLPTYVSKEKQSLTAGFIAGGLVVLGVIIAVVGMIYSSQQLSKAKSDEADARTRADEANSISKKADAIMASDPAVTEVRNLSLAKAMVAHSTVYPDLFDKVRGYIPPYFRITSMSAAPAGDTTCIVTLTGVISTYQQYADLMLALLRIPGATNVSRAGFQLDQYYVPQLTPEDQTGRPIKPGEQNIPDDPLAKLDYMEAQGSYSGYLGVSNYGGDSDLTRGPMPGASLITVQVTIPGMLMGPDPRATLSSGGGGGVGLAGATVPAGGASAGFKGPGNPPPGVPPAGAGIPSGGGAGAAPKGKGKAAGDDE